MTWAEGEEPVMRRTLFLCLRLAGSWEGHETHYSLPRMFSSEMVRSMVMRVSVIVEGGVGRKGSFHMGLELVRGEECDKYARETMWENRVTVPRPVSKAER
jgi:hypothetical protein